MNKLRATTPPAILLLTVFVLLALTSFLSSQAQTVSDLFFTNMILQVVIFILPALLYCKIRRRTVSHPGFTFSPLPFHPIFLLSLFGVLVLGSMLLNLGLTALSGTTREFGTNASSTLLQIADASGMLYVIFALCIIPAVAEEFFFRGILLSEYSNQNPAAAVLLTAIAFAASHFDLMQMPAYLFSGLLLAIALRVTRSLLAPILLHCASNLFNIFLLPYLWQVTLAPLGTLFTFFVLVGLILVCALVALREAEQIYTEYATDPRREKDFFGKAGSFLPTLLHGLFTPPYLCALLLTVLLAVL